MVHIKSGVGHIWPIGYCLQIPVYTHQHFKNLLERIVWTFIAPIKIPFEKSEF